MYISIECIHCVNQDRIREIKYITICVCVDQGNKTYLLSNKIYEFMATPPSALYCFLGQNVIYLPVRYRYRGSFEDSDI
jgi:hypothetical protein